MRPFRHHFGWLALTTALFALGSRSSAAQARPIPPTDLDLLFEEGRGTFFQEVAALLPASPHRVLLDSAETAALTGGLPDLYDRVMRLAWERDAPASDSLIAGGHRRALERHLTTLARESAGRLVEHLFDRSHNYELLMKVPGRSERRPLELMLATLGYGAKRGSPSPAPTSAPAPRSRRGVQWWERVVRLGEAHRVTTGRGVTVAVLDTGIDPFFGRFAEQIVPGPDLFGHRGPPWAGRSGEIAWDWAGHGTAVASVLLATAPGATVLPIRTGDGRVSNDPPYPYWLVEGLAASVYAAVHRGAQVVNISAGIDGFPVLHDAIRFAVSRGVVVVAAAGRYGRRQTPGEPFSPSYPASYAEVVAVGSFGPTDSGIVAWSQLHPSREMDLLAPGVDIAIAAPGYIERTLPPIATGTSLSAPIGAGVAALMIAADSATGPGERRSATYARRIEAALRASANPGLLGVTGFTPRTGYGALDAAAAIDQVRRK